MENLYKINNYPSATRFYDILKENNIKASHKEVKAFVDKQNVQQVLKPIFHQKSSSRNIVAVAPFSMWQIDLLEYLKYSKTNKGIKYLLVCVDLFTRKAYAIGIKSKTGDDCGNGFETILTDAGNKPNSVFHDQGNEYKGKFARICEAKHIASIQNDLGDHKSLGIIDRFSRTIKAMIQRYLVANNTTKFIDELPRLIKLYNDTPHSAIDDIKPSDASKEDNLFIIGDINFDKQKENQKINKFKINIVVGDRVRYKIDKGVFKKGYTITYSNDIYNVVSVSSKKAILSNGKEYKFENLQKVAETSDFISSSAIESAEKIAKQKRLMSNEGLKFI